MAQPRTLIFCVNYKQAKSLSIECVFFPFKGTSKAYNLSKVPKVRPFVPALLSLVFDCDVPSITSLPTQHQEGPLLHGEEIDSAVESVIAGF